jgi:RimJ/RimL family protein N-acetyltransferase
MGGTPRDFGPMQALAIIEDGALIGGVIVHNWNTEAETVEVSGIAIRPRYFRRAAQEVYDYVFHEMGCQAAILRIDAKNSPARRLVAALGAKEYIIPRMRGRAASEALNIITSEAWQQSRMNRHASTVSPGTS